MKMLDISHNYTHSRKPVIGYKSTGIIHIKSDKIIAYTQSHESTSCVLEMKIYKGQTLEGKEPVIIIYL